MKRSSNRPAGSQNWSSTRDQLNRDRGARAEGSPRTLDYGGGRRR